METDEDSLTKLTSYSEVFAILRDHRGQACGFVIQVGKPLV
jgi:hypothetical protein